MILTTESLKPTFEYLNKFFNCKIEVYRNKMMEAGPRIYRPGSEPFKGHNEAITCMREVVDICEHEFAAPNIPKGFPTPERFYDAATNFIKVLEDHVEKILQFVAKNDDQWEEVFTDAFEICSDTRDAIKHALLLATESIEATPLSRLVKILERLPAVSRVLRKNRRELRSTLEITDEYDVQDLLHGILTLDFDDIRREPSGPNFSGCNSRLDFLLNQEIVIEVKHMKKFSTQKKLTDEILSAIPRYKTYPNVKHMICAIWDTEHHLKNEVALKSDLEKAFDGFVTVVVMR